MSSFELATHDDLTDVDASRPDAWGYLAELEAGHTPDVGDYR